MVALATHGDHSSLAVIVVVTLASCADGGADGRGQGVVGRRGGKGGRGGGRGGGGGG